MLPEDESRQVIPRGERGSAPSVCLAGSLPSAPSLTCEGAEALFED